MQSATLEKPNWQTMLDQVSRLNEGQQITIQIDAPDIGAQGQAEGVQFRGITYDPRDDAVSVNAEGLEHMIQRPTKVEFAYEGADLICIEIGDADGAVHLVKFTPPLGLPEQEHL